MELIAQCDALKPNGHYSLAVSHNGLVFISGILPFDSDTGLFINGSVELQAQAVFKNLDKILKTSGSDKNKILKTTIYIPDIQMWPQINELYQLYFDSHMPARCIVPTGALHFNAKLELEAVAYI